MVALANTNWQLRPKAEMPPAREWRNRGLTATLRELPEDQVLFIPGGQRRNYYNRWAGALNKQLAGRKYHVTITAEGAWLYWEALS